LACADIYERESGGLLLTVGGFRLIRKDFIFCWDVWRHLWVF